MFQVGQLVKCIDNATDPGEPGPYLMLGGIYVIAEILWEETSGPWGRGWEPTLIFDGIPVERHSGWSTGYNPEFFRPISSDRLSIFRQHLAPVDKVLT